MKWEDYIRINKEEVEEWSLSIKALIKGGREIGIPLDIITKLDEIDKAGRVIGKTFNYENRVYVLSPEEVAHYKTLLEEINNSQMFNSKTVEDKKMAALRNTIRDKNIRPR